MVRVFISYCDKVHGEGEKANKWALQLETYLRETDDIYIEPILAPKVRSPAVEIAKKVANEIEKSHVFITFYTKDAQKETPWLDQELGYAIRVARERGLSIIALWEGKREEYAKMGFLSSEFIHLDDKFQLNKNNPKKTFEEVRGYMIYEYKHPIEMFMETLELDSNGNKIEMLLTLMNNSPGILKDATLSFVLPKIPEKPGQKKAEIKINPIEENNIIQKKTRMRKTGWIEEYIEDKSKIIPKAHDKKGRFVKGTGIEIIRYQFLLKEIYGSTAYESKWRFTVKGHTYREFFFGSYLNVPIFGPVYYQGGFFTNQLTSKLERKDIGIEIKALT